jgi:nucleoside-diphosphate-sugar epimerase
MKKIGIIGSSGFIGRHLVNLLLSNDDYLLELLVHNNIDDSWQKSKKIKLIKGDIFRNENIEDITSEVDVLIILTYLANRTESENIIGLSNILVSADKNNIKKVIYVSTAILIGNVNDNVITEETTPNPKNSYEKTKLRLEELFSKFRKERDWYILRPTAVFGPNGKNIVKLINDRLIGGAISRFFRSLIFCDRKLNLVSVNRVTSAICFFIERELKAGTLFIVSNDEDINNNYMFLAKKIDSAFSLTRVPMVKFPLIMYCLKFVLFLTGKSATNPKRIYSNKKIRDLGWDYERLFCDEIDEYLEWYKGQQIK